MQRAHLHDFEDEVIPGVVCGQKYIPVDNVGAYLPGRPLPAAGQCLHDRRRGPRGGRTEHRVLHPALAARAPHPAVLYAARASGADRIFALGGVQALAAMAFGLLDGRPADMIVGAGNAYVAEAKRQLYGKVGIDVLAGPSEVAVIADETATAEMVAADLLAQAEHGPSSPACLVTTSAELAAAVEVEIERQLEGLATRDIAGAAWRDWGSIYVADSAKTAIEIMDLLAPEHLEILTADPDFYLDNLHNYGSLFLGRVVDGGVRGQGHVGHQPRAAHRPRRALHRRAARSPATSSS